MSASHTANGPSPTQMRANLIRGDLDRAKRYLTFAMDSSREHGCWAIGDSIGSLIARVETVQIQATEALSDDRESGL